MARKPTDTVQLKLRFGEKLRKRLAQDAARNNRSLNAEIIAKLENSYSVMRDLELVRKTAEMMAASAIEVDPGVLEGAIQDGKIDPKKLRGKLQLSWKVEEPAAPRISRKGRGKGRAKAK